MSTYRNSPDWCMNAPTAVDMKSIGLCSNDKNYRCPQCGKRVKMALYNYEPYGSKQTPTWCWPAHKIRKTKR